MYNKKSVSEIVTISLLLIVTIIVYFGFQTWFSSYSTSLNANIENQYNNINLITIEGLTSDKLYLKTYSQSIISILSIKDLNNNILCKLEDNIKTDFQANTLALFNIDSETVNTTHIKDLTGYNNNGIFLGSGYNCSQTGISGNGCEFDALDNGGRIEISSQTKFDFNKNSDFGVFLWFKKTTDCDSVDNTNEVMLTRYGYGNANSTWWFGCRSDLDRLHLTFVPKNSAGNVIISDVTIDDGLWHFGGWQYSKDNKKLYLYLDGIVVNSTDVTDFEYGFDSSQSICIGAYRSSVGSACDRYEYNGILDEIAIYDKYLSDEEVRLLYESKKTKFYEQLMPSKIIKSIEISSCNLEFNQPYNILISNKNSITHQKRYNK